MTALFEVSAADVASTSDDWYTPHWIFEAAGLVFDMDVAAPVDPSRRTCPARRYLTPVEDGLACEWDGLVWMNPPYSDQRPWASRFARHNCGLALVPATKGAGWLRPLLPYADALTLISTSFVRPDGSAKNIPFVLTLIGCGPVAAAAVGRVAAADRYAQGAYYVRPGVTR